MELWWSLSGRHTMMNLSRYSHYCEKAIRLQLSKPINFFEWMFQIQKHMGGIKIIVFDPSHIGKSGKHTYGIGKFWSGTDQRVKKGLEIGCLAAVDVKQQTAYHLEVVQTPARATQNLITHYVNILLSRIEQLLQISRYVVVDGYFMKHNFIEPLVQAGMHVITKMRSDANLQYLYQGLQKKGRGRKRKVCGKVDVKNIDKRKWKICLTTPDLIAYELAAWCVTLKSNVKVVYLQDRKSKAYEILVSTDTEQRGKQIIQYYRLRFQIEFFIRDAKQHSGLEHCQARSQQKLHNHFNLSLANVSLAKQIFWSPLPNHDQVPFSMRTIKILYHNKLIAETIFSNLALDLNNKKIRRLFQECISIGGIAA
jgi:hypothetical protein